MLRAERSKAGESKLLIIICLFQFILLYIPVYDYYLCSFVVLLSCIYVYSCNIINILGKWSLVLAFH